MKIAATLAIICLLNSCNTAIGIWRDTKQGFIWSKNKIQQSSDGGGDNYDPYGAPTY